MNEIEIYTQNLPTTIEDVSKFVLFGREKLTSIRAEIRAINKLQIAEEVRNQKKEEAQLLAEALLDAEVKLGELFQALPKATKGNQYTGKMVDDSSVDNQYKSASDSGVDSKNNKTNDSGVDSYSNTRNNNSPHHWGELNTNILNDNGVDKLKDNCQSHSSGDLPKKEVIQNLGFNQKQAERFETLAKNKDLVEQVKQEARENDDIPTRTQVLSLAKARKQKQEQKEEEYKEFCKNSEKSKKLFNQLVDSLGFIRRMKDEDIELSMITLDSNSSNDIIKYIQEAQIKLATLKREANKYRGVKLWQDD